MTKVYYSEETKNQKKVKLSSYFDSINTALDAIKEVDVASNWESSNNETVSGSLKSLIDKIPSIKESLQSFDEFLGVTDKTYNEASKEVEDALRHYNKK